MKQYDPTLTMRIPPAWLEALDAYRSSVGDVTRSAAARMILVDWLRTHGFSPSDLQPTGPATDVVKAMDEAISGDRKRRHGNDTCVRQRKGKA